MLGRLAPPGLWNFVHQGFNPDNLQTLPMDMDNYSEHLLFRSESSAELVLEIPDTDEECPRGPSEQD